MKNTQSKIKPIKTGKELGTTYRLGCKDFTHNFRPQEVKMTNKVLRGKSNCVVCRSINCQQQKLICVKCRKNTENLNSKMFKTKNGRLFMQSKCTDYGIKNSRFVKEQEAKALLNNLGIKAPLSKIPLLNVLF